MDGHLLPCQPPDFWGGFPSAVKTWMQGFAPIQPQEHLFGTNGPKARHWDAGSLIICCYEWMSISDILSPFSINVQKMKTPHECTLCHTSQPMSGMVHFNTGEDMVELFCTRTCVTSYRLRPAIECDLNGTGQIVCQDCIFLHDALHSLFIVLIFSALKNTRGCFGVYGPIQVPVRR